MGTHRPPVVMPDMKRRRASTGERIATIMTLARRLPLTRQVLADQLADATPSQMEFMESWMNAEIESRERSKRSRLLKAAGFPADKELGDPNMAAAIIDRTVHHGRMIRFEGESWRKTHALMQ